MQVTAENISDTFCLLSLFIDISLVAESSKPKLTNMLKYPIMDNEKFTNPKFSIPKTLTKYGKVIKGNTIFTPCNTDRDKKFSIRLLLSFDLFFNFSLYDTL